MDNKKFFKSKGNYVQSQRHTILKDGSYINEKDISTLDNSVFTQIGQSVIYNQGNFVFSVGTEPEGEVKNFTNGSWVGLSNKLTPNVEDAKRFKYGDVLNQRINIIEYDKNEGNYIINYDVENIKMFASYGSATKLASLAINDIISKYPASIYVSDKLSTGLNIFEQLDENIIAIDLNYISNPYDICLINNFDVTDIKGFELLRFLPASFSEYELETDNGVVLPILNFQGLTIDVETSILEDDKLYLEIDGVIPDDTKSFHIRPKSKYLEMFFESLDDFQNNLLNRNTKPYRYTSTFVLPQFKDGYNVYSPLTFIWKTTDGYNLDINTNYYFIYIEELNSRLKLLDEIYSNFINRMMVHESIKKEEFILDDDSTDNYRISRIMEIYGRNFDDLKREIYGLSIINNNTFSNKEGFSNELYNVKLKNLGWDTTNLNLNFNDTIKVDYPSSFDILNYKQSENEINRRLYLISNALFKNKGTINSIESIINFFGIPYSDYELDEYVVKTTKLIPLKSEQGVSLEYIDKLCQVLGYEDRGEGNYYYDLPIKKEFVANTRYTVEDYLNGVKITEQNKFINVYGEIYELLDNDLSIREFGTPNLVFTYGDGSAIDSDHITRNVDVLCKIKTTSPYYDEVNDISYSHGLEIVFKGIVEESSVYDSVSVIKPDEIKDNDEILYKSDRVVKHNVNIYAPYGLFYHKFVYIGNYYGIPKVTPNTNFSYFESKGYWYRDTYGNKKGNILINPNNPHGDNDLYGTLKTPSDILNNSEYFSKFKLLFNFLNTSEEYHNIYSNYDHIIQDENGEYVTEKYNFFEKNQEAIGFDDMFLVKTNKKVVKFDSLYNIDGGTNVSLNTKILHLKTKFDNDNTREFFKNTVLHYIEQLIPSTTLFMIT